MVSVVHALPDSGVDEATLARLIEGLPEEGAQKLLLAITHASELYGDAKVSSGETAFGHGLGAALILASLAISILTARGLKPGAATGT